MYPDLQSDKQHRSAAQVLRHAPAFLKASAAATISIGVLALTGCGAQYRPVVSAINPVGPASQPTKYAVAVSSPSPTTPGLVTFVDVSGDEVLSTPSILTNPSYFAVTAGGTEGFVINSSGSLNDFGLGNPTGLLTSNIVQTTLPVNSGPVSVSAFTPSNASTTIFVPEQTSSKIAALGASTSTLFQEISVGANPVYVVGTDGASRVYAISQNAGGAGQVAALEALSATSFAVSATIPVGNTPVYGVMTTDTRRAFILNKGSGTVSVINEINNALDSTTPTITLPNIPYSGGTAAPNPVWADLSTVYSELVVLNQGDGIHPGSLSIISIPLCNPSAQATNPNCNAANPADATGFGQIVATVPVGVNPVMVSVLHDGSRAYVANAGNSTTPGSVSVVNLISGTVSATINTGADQPTNLNTGTVFGLHPNSIAATTGSPTGKVYVTSSDSHYLTILFTDTDTVQNHITLQGLGLRVQLTSP